jgi:hypothetical protein
MRTKLVILTLLLVSTVQANPPPSTAAPDEQLRTAFAKLNPIVDKIWIDSTRGASGPSDRPTIVLQVEGDSMRAHDGQVEASLEFLTNLMSLGYFVGHDQALADSNDVREGDSILDAPIARTSILSQDTVRLFGENATASVMFSLHTICSTNEPECFIDQQSAFVCGFTFVLAHEFSHVIAGDRTSSYDAYPVDKEIAADKAALRVMRMLASDTSRGPSIASNDGAMASCLAMPAAFLEMNVRNAPEALKPAFSSRKEAYMASLGEARDAVEEMVTLEKKVGGVGTLTVMGATKDDLVIMEGVDVSALASSPLTLSTGAYHIAVVGPRGFTSGRVIVKAGKVASFEATPTPFVPADGSALRSLERKGDWPAIVVGASEARLKPRSTGVAMQLWKAMHRLHLDAWIEPIDADGLTKAEVRSALRWRNRGVPSSGWDSALGTDDP